MRSAKDTPAERHRVASCQPRAQSGQKLIRSKPWRLPASELSAWSLELYPECGMDSPVHQDVTILTLFYFPSWGPARFAPRSNQDTGSGDYSPPLQSLGSAAPQFASLTNISGSGQDKVIYHFHPRTHPGKTRHSPPHYTDSVKAPSPVKIQLTPLLYWSASLCITPSRKEVGCTTLVSQLKRS